MTGKEALRLSLTMSATDARREYETSESATLRLVCGWKLNEPVAYHDIVEVAGIAPIPDDPYESCGDISHTVKRTREIIDYFADWHTYEEAVKDLDDKYMNLKSRIGRLKQQGRKVEKRRRNPNVPGNWEYRVQKEQAA